jgi:hypothetical protein
MTEVGNYRNDLDMSMLEGKITFKKSSTLETQKSHIIEGKEALF